MSAVAFFPQQTKPKAGCSLLRSASYHWYELYEDMPDEQYL